MGILLTQIIISIYFVELKKIIYLAYNLIINLNKIIIDKHFINDMLFQFLIGALRNISIFSYVH